MGGKTGEVGGCSRDKEAVLDSKMGEEAARDSISVKAFCSIL